MNNFAENIVNVVEYLNPGNNVDTPWADKATLVMPSFSRFGLPTDNAAGAAGTTDGHPSPPTGVTTAPGVVIYYKVTLNAGEDLTTAGGTDGAAQLQALADAQNELRGPKTNNEHNGADSKIFVEYSWDIRGVIA